MINASEVYLKNNNDTSLQCSNNYSFLSCLTFRMKHAISKEAQFVEVSLNNAQEYEAEHLKLQEKHHQLRLHFQRQQHEATIALEKQLKTEVESLMSKYQDKWLP